MKRMKNTMNEGKLRQWCYESGEGCSNICGEKRNGRPSIQTDYIIEHLNVKVRENHCFMIISDNSIDFPNIVQNCVQHTRLSNMYKLGGRNVDKYLRRPEIDICICFFEPPS